MVHIRQKSPRVTRNDRETCGTGNHICRSSEKAPTEEDVHQNIEEQQHPCRGTPESQTTDAMNAE